MAKTNKKNSPMLLIQRWMAHRDATDALVDETRVLFKLMNQDAEELDQGERVLQDGAQLILSLLVSMPTKVSENRKPKAKVTPKPKPKGIQDKPSTKSNVAPAKCRAVLLPTPKKQEIALAAKQSTEQHEQDKRASASMAKATAGKGKIEWVGA